MQNENALSKPAVPFSILQGHKRGWHFADDPAGGAGSGDPPPADKGKKEPSPPPGDDTVSRAELGRATKDRDAAKRRLAAVSKFVSETLGVDESDIELIDTGDPAKPLEVKIEGADTIKKTIAAAKKTGKTAEQLVADADAKWQKKVEGEKERGNRRVSARERFIGDELVGAQIRAACLTEGCIDKAVPEVDQLIRKRVKVSFAESDDGESITHEVKVFADDGTPLLIENKPATIGQLVADYLKERPWFKKDGRMYGPDAGGGRQGNNGNAAGGAAPASGDRNIAAEVLGLRPRR